MSRIAQLKERADAVAAKAREIAEKAEAENRDMTDDEQADHAKSITELKDILEAVKTAKADEGVLDQAKKFADSVGGVPAEKDLRARAKSLGLTVVESPEFKAMLKPFTSGEGNISIPQKARIHSDPIQVKSLFTGGSSTSAGAFVVNERTDIIEMLGRKPLTIRELCANRRTTSDTVEYVAQTSHTNNAAPVPEATTTEAPTAPEEGGGALIRAAGGGYKPEGAWAFEVRTAVVKTIAEWVPSTKRALADVSQLEGLINDELRRDVAEAEEDEILNGDGTGEHFVGINETSGIQTQAFSTDIFETVRKGITLARTVGRVNPNAVVLNPTDAEAIDLTKDANDRYYFGGPQSIMGRTLWGVPVVESESQAAGTGLLGDFGKAVIWDREQTTISMTDSHEDYFVRNLVAVLAEERLAFAVTRPTAFVSLDLTA
ncbi:phage major capsid protein [Mycolicibacterium elephantis]|uniref:phage major capsid protein n=1 Tax=Mycolicibacterium elephantis TaxID=81858 RepID=UPI0007E98D3D|nr:phage major capsid protein [Mycolicibacterium elephantis]OBB20609.1 major capsid protein [Mycolicibacterium elephantis]